MILFKKKKELILDSCALQAPIEQPPSPELIEDVEALEVIREKAKAGEIILWRGVNIFIEGRLAPNNIQSAINTYWNGAIKLLPQEIGFYGTRVSTATQNDYEHNRKRYEQRLQEILTVIPSDSKDFTHLVNAEYFGIPYVITTDYSRIRSIRNSTLKLKVRVLRPVEFLKEK